MEQQFNDLHHICYPKVKREVTLLRNKRATREFFRTAVNRVSIIFAIEISKKFILNVSLLIVFLGQTVSFPQVYPDVNVDSTLKNGIDAIINQNYYLANHTFTKLSTNYPDLPLGKIYLAAVQIAKSYDYGEDYNKLFIDSLLNSAAEQSKRLLNEDNQNIWNQYFLSLSEGYLAYFNALNDDWIGSFTEGFSALDDFNNLVERDSDFYDALIAIGTFKYWKSRKMEFLSWLPGYIDERKDGIKMLEDAAEHHPYNQYLAVNSLIWINIDKKNYIKAAELAESIMRKYPRSRFFMWGLARAYEEINPEKSIKVYRDILISFPGNLNHYNEIVLKHLMAQQYRKIGKNQEVVRLCDEILSTKITDKDVLPRIKERLKRVKELRKEMK